MLERFFALKAEGSTWQRETGAGITTFLTMAYIIFLQPAILSGALFGMDTGLDAGAVLMATCLSAALASILMGLFANLPVALAPGMGLNFFFVFTVLPACATVQGHVPWKVALGVVLLSGILFLILTLLRIRELILAALSDSLKSAIAVGIGMFIAFIGLRNGGVIIASPGTTVAFNHQVTSPDILIFVAGLTVTAALMARKVRGAILIGILFATLLAAGVHGLLAESKSELVAKSALMTLFKPAVGIVAAPPSMAPTFLQADLIGALSLHLLPFVIVFLFMDMFDTMGTLVGVTKQSGLMKDGQIPRLSRALGVDAIATGFGALFGTSTVTSFIESTAGVQAGGRTGLTAVVAGLCFLLAIFFQPIIGMIGSYAVITAPALVVVGGMMAANAVDVDWKDPAESLPAFLTIIGIPLSYSISDGIAMGVIAAAVIRVLSGRAREVSLLGYGLALGMVAYFVFVRSRMGV